MRVMEIRGAFGLANLVLGERPKPSAGPGQVLLRMRAASLNYRDLLMIRGHYNPRQPLPLVPCSDGVGEVVALGDGVSGVAVGDRVTPLFCQGWLGGAPSRERLRNTLGGPLDGTLCELLAVDAHSVVPVPAHLTDQEAACLPCAGVTAYTALLSEGGLAPGQWVLVQGTGGVSLFALQLARAAGARVIVTSSSDQKLARARALGAEAGVNYRTTAAWGKAVRALTGGAGVDHVVEVGGADTLEQSLRCVRPGGRIHLIGVLSGVSAKIPLTSVLMQAVRIQGILVGHRDSHEALCRVVEAHALRPVVDRVFPLAETRQALELMAAGGHFGKIVVRLDA